MTASTALGSGPPRLRGRAGLRGPDFRRLWVGETTSALGSSITSVALPLVALTTLHAGVIPISILSGLAWVPWLVIGLPAGAWIDRLPRRPVMIVCDAASLALFLSIPVAAWLGVLTMAQLFAVALLAGTAEVFFSTAYRAFLPALLDDDELVAGNARLQGSESAASVAGPGLGGVLAQLVGAVAGILVDALSFLVSLLCIRGIRTPEQPVPTQRRSLRAEIAEGMRFVLHDRLLRILMIFGGAANFVLTGYGALTVVFLVREVHLTSGAAGLLLAAGQVGGVLGALAAPWLARTVGSARALLICKVAATPFGLLIPLTGAGWHLTFFVVGAMGLVAGVVGGNVIHRGFMQAYCPPALMGRITTCTMVVNFGSIPIGAVLSGVLADSLGLRTALWLLLGGFVVASTILLLAPIHGSRDLPTRHLPRTS